MVERYIIEKIYGPKWGGLTALERDTALKVIKWCIDNKEELPEGITVHPFYQELALQAVNESLIEIYGQSLDEIMVHNRHRENVDTRRMAISVIRKITGIPFSRIAYKWGFTPSTLSLGQRRHNDNRRYKDYNQKFILLEEKSLKRWKELSTSVGELGSLEE